MESGDDLDIAEEATARGNKRKAEVTRKRDGKTVDKQQKRSNKIVPETPKNSKTVKTFTEKKGKRTLMESSRDVHKPKKIRLGTFFSGLETPSIACKLLTLDVQLQFIIEADPKLNTHAVAKWKPAMVCGDIRELSWEILPDVDLAIGGPPCQPFCPGGKRGGLEDPRGELLFSMVRWVDYLKKEGRPLPSVIIIEQSKMILCKKFKPIYCLLKKSLVEIGGYTVRAKTLDTAKHGGLPQHRERAYIVAWLPSGRRFTFPKETPCQVSLNDIISPKNVAVDSQPCASPTNQERIKDAVREATEAGYDPANDYIFVDCDASSSFKQWQVGSAPTLTRTRGYSGGPYLTNRCRRLSLQELMKLQGFPPRVMKRGKLTAKKMQAALGNAMTCSILERLIPRALWASGLIQNPMFDKWSDEAFIKKGAHFQ